MCYRDDLVANHHPSPRRGPAGRREHLITRKSLLTACMRRPWPVVLSRAAAGLRAGGAARSGVLAAGRRPPSALRRRRPVSDQVERRLRELATAPIQG